MRGLRIFVFTMALTATVAPLSHAVSWSPLEEDQGNEADKSVREKGAFVCLFQSGTTDVKKEIRVNDVLSVFRETRDHRLTEVGKVRILSYVGADFLKGEVIEGKLLPGDIARKGDVASLVISRESMCRDK